MTTNIILTLRERLIRILTSEHLKVPGIAVFHLGAPSSVAALELVSRSLALARVTGGAESLSSSRAFTHVVILAVRRILMQVIFSFN